MDLNRFQIGFRQILNRFKIDVRQILDRFQIVFIQMLDRFQIDFSYLLIDFETFSIDFRQILNRFQIGFRQILDRFNGTFVLRTVHFYYSLPGRAGGHVQAPFVRTGGGVAEFERCTHQTIKRQGLVERDDRHFFSFVQRTFLDTTRLGPPPCPHGVRRCGTIE